MMCTYHSTQMDRKSGKEKTCPTRTISYVARESILKTSEVGMGIISSCSSRCKERKRLTYIEKGSRRKEKSERIVRLHRQPHLTLSPTRKSATHRRFMYDDRYSRQKSNVTAHSTSTLVYHKNNPVLSREATRGGGLRRMKR